MTDLSLGFSTEIVEEGRASVAVPRLEAYVKEGREYAPSRAPVFYNPLMELNRDIAVLALQAYQKLVDKEIFACEPLAGCGIRGVRFATEVEGVRRVVLNDLNPEASRLAQLNVERNKLTNRVTVMNEDANLLLSRYAAPRRRFDFIDVDPFGSPVRYLDSAIRALRDGGLLAITATDMAPLCGVHPKACVRKYGGKPLRTEYCHELALRLLIGCLAMMAAKHDVGIEVVFTHSTDHYIRLYILGHYGAKQADRGLGEMGHVLHCFACSHREASKGMFSPLRRECPECGSKLESAGPLWLGKLLDERFCMLMESEAEERSLRQGKRIHRLLSRVREEAEAPITYYVIDKVCDQLGLPVPPMSEVLNGLEKVGFRALTTHFHNRGFRTDAPAKGVREVMAKLAVQP